ncbi:MAG: hypothetical protein HYZ51_01535 [Candidatus Doudnabacteria bacterium]|nr:hypothetical protein [Candidatus Doudnabacteria bacterium]
MTKHFNFYTLKLTSGLKLSLKINLKELKMDRYIFPLFLIGVAALGGQAGISPWIRLMAGVVGLLFLLLLWRGKMKGGKGDRPGDHGHLGL